MNLRGVALKLSEWLGAYGQHETWRKVDGYQWVCTSPRRFGSARAFENFLEAARRGPYSLPENKTVVRLFAEETSLDVIDAPAAAEWLSLKSERLRSRFGMKVSFHEGSDLDLFFGSDSKGRIQPPSCTLDLNPSEERRAWLCELVLTHSVEASRRDWKAGRQVVDPIDPATDLAERTSHRLSLRASVIGGVSGLVTTGIAQLALFLRG